ncbi:MAG: NAD-dependent DNA ligase [Rhodopirellula sp.]|nr:NAD-dependent DNA ligase [Rhodopirellula sp.]HCA36798.1 NAD-dependent DNA ligase [Gammaproteobacteria bacterium]
MSEDKSPLFQRFGKSRLDDRKLDQLLGICEGVIADGTVNRAEAQFLQSWLVKNADIAEKWPANVMLARIDEMLADGVLDDDEQGELVKLLMDVAGIHVGEDKTASTLPLCDPAPDLEFSGSRFVLTGKFASGTRKECEAMVVAVGGSVAKNVTKETDVVVVGELVSDSWIHESYGRKIEKAVEYREEGRRPNIVSEKHWADCINRQG